MDMAWLLLLSSFVTLVVVITAIAGVCDGLAAEFPGVERHGL